MLNRRDAIIAMAGALMMPATSSNASDAALPTSASVAQPNLTISERLMYSTVRLFNQTGNTLHWGTGFLFHLFKMGDSAVPVIITNRHVVQDWNKCSFALLSRSADGAPNLENHIPIELPEFQSKFFTHPSVDLAIIPIAEILNDLSRRKQSPFYSVFDQSLIPSEDELKELLPLEEILTIGFPGLLWDDVHNLPLFHRGYTATAPYVDFKGKKEFLIDIATWPGSSGSPVLLFNEGSFPVRGGSLAIGSRAKLLGIVYGVAQQDVTGNVVIQNAPTQVVASVPTNLGACIRASRILEFEPLLVSRGFQPPAGYVMRAQ
jgi:hypothetical protein